MKWKTLFFTLFLFFSVSYGSAASSTLRWSRLGVTAHLDSDGRLHVQERHSIVFDGDWNGGERVFRTSLENVLRLERISRIDASGRVIPLQEDESLTRVDDYAWHDSNTLRWRSRLASDPPFQNQEITYLLEYTDANILIPADGSYLLDHNFGMPDLEWPIDAYSLDLSLDPVWQPLDDVPKHITRANQPHGENLTVTAHLRHAGAAPPAAVNAGAPGAIRYALLSLLLAGTALLVFLFLRVERVAGRFAPLPDPASIDRQWLDENVFKFLPEVVGAAWDDRTGAAEVAAVIARMVHEGKLSSRVEKRGFFKRDELVLTLLRKKESFDGYEKSLVKSLFIDGDTTSTETIKAYYKKKGFDPVSMIRDPLQRKLRDIGRKGGAPKVDWKAATILLLAGLALLILGGFYGPFNMVGGIVTAAIVLGFFVIGLLGALDYGRRLSNPALWSIEFVPAILLTLAVPVIALRFRFSMFTLSGLVLVSLAAIRAILSAARSRDGGERLENRRRLAAARDYFARELRHPNPALDDAWFPYLLAFGLGANVDRWFRAFGIRSSGISSASFGSSSPSSSTSTSTSTSSSGSGWTGGGGAFGGAGASGAWGVAAAGMAAGVSSPSSGGGGGGGGGSSGGGGGGGW